MSSRPNTTAMVVTVVTDDISQLTDDIRNLILNEGQNYSEAMREFLFVAYKRLLDEKRRVGGSG